MESHRIDLEAFNIAIQAETKYIIKQSEVEGTDAFIQLQAINKEIQDHNNKLKLAGIRIGRKYARKPHQIFKEELFTRQNKKGGMDFIHYALIICKKFLFPYYLEVKAAYPNRNVYLIQDNAGLHHKAVKLLHKEVIDDGIQFVA
jgi:hypothetical protein